MFAFQREGPVITQIKVLLTDGRHNSVKWPVFEQQQNMTGSNTSRAAVNFKLWAEKE